MARLKISRKECKQLYKYFYDASNRFASAGTWSMDTAVLVICYNAKIRNNTRFKFQELRNFRIVYENDANFRYLISTLKDLDRR